MTELTNAEKKLIIAKRTAQELNHSKIVNVGIGIPTQAADLMENEDVFIHTENGLLGVGPYDSDNINPNLVNAGKLPVTLTKGAAFFSSAESFAMIRGGHVDTVVLGALQIDQQGVIANWAVPGKNIIGVGGAMDLLEGAKKVIVTLTHTDKHGNPKILKKLTYPKTSLRQVDIIITELSVFKVMDGELHLTELLNGTSLETVEEFTEADYIINLKD